MRPYTMRETGRMTVISDTQSDTVWMKRWLSQGICGRLVRIIAVFASKNEEMFEEANPHEVYVEAFPR